MVSLDSIPSIAKERSRPSIYILRSMQGHSSYQRLDTEMDRCNIHYEGTVAKGESIKDGELDAHLIEKGEGSR